MTQWLIVLSSSRGPAFSSQHSQGSQPSVTPVLEDAVLSSGLCGHSTHLAHRQNVGKTHTPKVKLNPKSLKSFLVFDTYKFWPLLTYIFGVLTGRTDALMSRVTACVKRQIVWWTNVHQVTLLDFFLFQKFKGGECFLFCFSETL